ncbi:hypothetical protein TWF106_003102 [Orbilia oligospora]|uniref:Uncharacterized protein n=1 Tax=Orbilia oligospora TaxID=2813651 RepID=A0A6G1LUQ5_ORBOL|nr:hypothetical protein TWF106_003102 [Orbilia oligospora]KAF3204748.1 hypothetical protein TWF191_002178 [Orbilia oligospora]KAF3218104.1 hypothetical protein TWF679_001512 [Orbilia oligospora]KAF3234647.1 hypothetical protein TWF192_001230 [Orbilia oligospora]
MKFTLFAPIAMLAASVAAIPMSSSGSSLAASGQEAVPQNFYEQFTKRQARMSPKDFAIRRAERFNATTERIDFLKSIPDETFQKMADNDRKLHQATRALWNGTIPDMAALPTAFTPPPGGFPRGNGTRRGGPRGRFGRFGPGGPGGPGGPDGAAPTGERPSMRDFFVRMAEFRGASAETIEKLKTTDESEFTGLRDLNTKDKFVKEATLMGLDDKVTFFGTVPQAIYDELDTLKTKTRAAHEDLRNGKVPTL